MVAEAAAAAVDLADSEEAALAVVVQVEIGKSAQDFQHYNTESNLTQAQLLVQLRNFNIGKSFSEQPFAKINLDIVFSMHQEKFFHF